MSNYQDRLLARRRTSPKIYVNNFYTPAQTFINLPVDYSRVLMQSIIFSFDHQKDFLLMFYGALPNQGSQEFLLSVKSMMSYLKVNLNETKKKCVITTIFLYST